MKKYIFSALASVLLSTSATAEWVRIGENNRWVAYADTAVRYSGATAYYWVMYDYKAVQESPRSGKRYLSEKAQYETRCQAEQNRVRFFTWHSERMGNGVVVYTGNKPTTWEPTSAPDSIANSFWKFVCFQR